MFVGDDVIVVDDEAGSPTIHRIASVVVTGELNGHRVVARDDELGTEHLGQPEVAATLSLRYRPCEMYFCPMTGNRGSQPSGSRSPARSIELRMRWRVTASPAAGRPRCSGIGRNLRPTTVRRAPSSADRYPSQPVVVRVCRSPPQPPGCGPARRIDGRTSPRSHATQESRASGRPP